MDILQVVTNRKRRNRFGAQLDIDNLYSAWFEYLDDRELFTEIIEEMVDRNDIPLKYAFGGSAVSVTDTEEANEVIDRIQSEIY